MCNSIFIGLALAVIVCLTLFFWPGLDGYSMFNIIFLPGLGSFKLCIMYGLLSDIRQFLSVCIQKYNR